MDWPRKAAFALLFLLAAVIEPRPATAADATIYELMENMSIVQRDGRQYRQGVAALDGRARPGTLLCPLPTTCELHGIGTSSVDIATGKGTFSGFFTVVVDGDNAVDGPEVPVATGRFSGTMDFSPAFLWGQPYGTVVGTVTVGSVSSPFTGPFLLPFVFPGDPSNTPYYLAFTGLMPNGTVVPVGEAEKALNRPTVKFEICLAGSAC